MARSGSFSVLPHSRGIGRAGFWLGFALGGFFDGILLHQVLQWHHLLSGVEGAMFQDVRVQVLADGLFHLLMYVIAVWGLLVLWRQRRELTGPGAGRILLAAAAFGFGIWHVIDAVLSHWVLGLHRIRMDAPNPLLWDLAWFLVFGIGALALAWVVARRGAANRNDGAGRTAAIVLAAAVLGGGPVATLPPRDTGIVMALFPEGTRGEDVFAAAIALDARPVWHDGSGLVWAIDLPPNGTAADLYRHGAVLVSRGLIPAACFSWLRV
jgi:uncharacterized membrane protein